LGSVCGGGVGVSALGFGQPQMSAAPPGLQKSPNCFNTGVLDACALAPL